MQVAVPLALLTALVVVAQTTELHLHSAKQAANECAPDSESCVLLSSCTELQGFLQSPTKDNILQLQKLRCGTHDTEAMVCCQTPRPLPTKGEHFTPPATSTTAPRSGEALLSSVCGRQPPLTRIELGTTAHIAEYPWSAVLGFRGSMETDSFFWGCGGSLINERYVLTAAHCTLRSMTNNTDLQIVRLGEFNLDSDEVCFYTSNGKTCRPAPAVLDFSPMEVVRHPDFNTRGAFSDDVALIRLHRAVQLSYHIGPVCLPAPGKTFSVNIGDIAPMGIGFEEKESGLRTAKLRDVRLFIVPMQECRSIYNTTVGTGEGQVCLIQEKADVCLHHPGAPVVEHPDPYGPPFVQVGIASYATVPCQQDVPSVYTDVAHYRDWIVANLKP